MELTDLAASFSLNKICRLCMGKDLNFIPLFVQDNLSQKIEALVPLLKLCPDDGLPGQICSDCVNQVNTSYNFKLQCESSDFTMRRLLDFQNNQFLNENSRNAVVKEEFEDVDTIAEDVDNNEENKTSITIIPEIPSAGPFNISSKKESTSKSSNEDSVNHEESKIRKIRNIPKKRKSLTEDKVEEHEDENSTSHSETSLSQEIDESKLKCAAEKTKTSIVHTLKEREKRYFCHQCEKGFGTSTDLIRHLKIHEGEKGYTCQFCGMDFLVKESLHSHYKLHPGEKPFTCERCGEKFVRYISLKKHLRTHAEKAICHICGIQLKSCNTLRHHLSIHNVDRPFACCICGKTYNSKKTLSYHLALHSKEKTLSCEECGACFKLRTTLCNHMKIHTQEMNFVCLECGRKFLRKSGLQMHMRSHTGEKPNHCGQCDRSFTLKKSLVIHLRTHTGSKPYKCPICEKCFRDSDQLRKHIPTHDRVKPFACTECDKTFARKERLTCHLLTHSGERPFKCPYCSKGFVRVDNLQCHIKTMHSEENSKQNLE